MIYRNFTFASLFGLQKNRLMDIAHAVACVADPADHFSGSFRFVRGGALLIAAAGKEQVLSVTLGENSVTLKLNGSGTPVLLHSNEQKVRYNKTQTVT